MDPLYKEKAIVLAKNIVRLEEKSSNLKKNIRARQIYKIVDFYNPDAEKEAVFLESTMKLDRFIDVLGAIHFKFEVLIKEDICVEEAHFAFLFTKYYDFVDVTKECQAYHADTFIDKKDLEPYHRFILKSNEGDLLLIKQLELTTAREACCGNYHELMETFLPKSKHQEFEADVRSLRGHYLQRQH